MKQAWFCNINSLLYVWGMKYLLLIFILIGCTKQPPEPNCYKCTFGTIKIGSESFSPEPEVVCGPNAKNYKKYHSNGWQYPVSCKPVQ
jgi:hypothetical protein